GLGVGSAVFQRALAAQAQQAEAQQAVTVTAEMIQQAEWICGLKLSDADRRALAQGMTQSLNNFQRARAVALPNSVSPAINFNPTPWQPPAHAGDRGRVEPITQTALKRPDSPDELAFLPVTALAALIRTRQLSSLELT